jgi:hypothetical protein
MSTVNYASKYSAKVDERFTKASVTQAAFNSDYDWEGVSTVNVYSVGTSDFNDYKMTGMQRYGVPDELGTSTQAMSLTQDKSFTYTIDRRNYTDQMMVTEVGKSLRRQTDEKTIPMVDMYRLATLTAKAGTTKTGAITNAYEMFLDGVGTLMDNKAPLIGTFAWISTAFYKAIRLDDAFIKASDLGQATRFNGQVGTVEGVPLISVPTAWLPTGVEFIMHNRVAALAPVKLSELKTHDNPPGINGWLCEGRLYHDCFVLENKKKAIYVHKSA